MPKSPSITVFFDGACPLCRREIDAYRRCDRAGRLAFVDIADDPGPLAELGISQAQALAALHVRDRDGRVAVGVKGFLMIWDALPRWRLLATSVRRVPGLEAIARLAYAQIARHRTRLAGALCGTRRCR